MRRRFVYVQLLLPKLTTPILAAFAGPRLDFQSQSVATVYVFIMV